MKEEQIREEMGDGLEEEAEEGGDEDVDDKHGGEYWAGKGGEEAEKKAWTNLCAAAKTTPAGFTREEDNTISQGDKLRTGMEAVRRQRVAKHYATHGSR